MGEKEKPLQMHGAALWDCGGCDDGPAIKLPIRLTEAFYTPVYSTQVRLSRAGRLRFLENHKPRIAGPMSAAPRQFAPPPLGPVSPPGTVSTPSTQS